MLSFLDRTCSSATPTRDETRQLPSATRSFIRPRLRRHLPSKTPSRRFAFSGACAAGLMAYEARKRLDHNSYTVALLCALEVEMSAARYLLDEEHQPLHPAADDRNQYVLGEASGHNVVIVCLPAGYKGAVSAATVAIHLSRTFPSIRRRLLVGIGGGVPSKKNDIRLGDVVVGIPTDIHGGVVQYDLGNQTSTVFERKGFLSPPPTEWLQAINQMKSNHRIDTSRVSAFLNEMLERYPRLTEYKRPRPARDVLFKAGYEHVKEQDTCDRCDKTRAEKRSKRKPFNEPFIHYGLIASGNRVMKDAAERDRISLACGGAICFEMEAAGLMNEFCCIVIRGISDYADSHKNDEWSAYAAAAAAALAKELLLYMKDGVASQGNGERGLIYRNRSSLPIPPFSQEQDGTVTGHDHVVDNPKPWHTYQTLLKSLSFSRQDARLLNIRAAHRETCLWLFEQAQFKEWCDNNKVGEHHGFLWIKGKPGSGKSTLMKTLYDKAKRERMQGTTIAYFFNARAPGLLEKSSLGMYRSLVHQLLQALPHLQDHFVERFATKERDGDVDEWTILELQGFLIHVVESLQSQRLTIFIDALDEGEEDDVRHMVTFLEELGQTSVINGTSFKICLSSRHFPHISIKKGVSLTVEGQAGHDDDIVTYVKNHLDGDESPQMVELRDKLCRKASGVFLWVFLVVPMLKKLYDQGQPERMAGLLNEIPAELDDLFATILARDAENKDKSILLLQWTLFAERPLSPIELFFAVTAGSSENWSFDPPSKDTIKRYILNCSKGLAEVSKSEPPTIHFIHETVRGFLLQKNGLAKIRPELGDSMFGLSHDQLRESCLRYFARIDDPVPSSCNGPRKRKRANKSEDDMMRELTSTRFPFLEYAVTFIFNHADTAEGNGLSQKHFLRRFHAGEDTDLKKWINYRNLFQRYDVRRYKPEASLIYILSEHNLYNLVGLLVGVCDVNTPGERYGTALQAACVNGHEETARLLVEVGRAEINAQKGEHCNALLAAIFSRNDTVVRLIQSAGGVVPQKKLRPKLISTISRGYAFGVEVLLELGADVNAQDGYYGNALYAASSEGYDKIVRILLDRGADINAQGGFYGNALQAASYRGHDKIVQILLDRGADINTQGGEYGNALYAASREAHSKIVQILLDEGANINAQGGYHGNALYAASYRGHDKIVQILLDRGADINTQGGEYGNALQAASYRGHDKIVQILLDRGADVNAQGGYYGNALQAASLRGQEKNVQTLLDRGANINAQGGYQGNALYAASLGGHDRIVQILLDRGANVNAQGGYWGNALQAATRMGRSYVVQILRDRGAKDTA